MPALIALFVIVLAVVIRNIVIVPQASSYVVERMGIYSATWSAGLQDRKSTRLNSSHP